MATGRQCWSVAARRHAWLIALVALAVALGELPHVLAACCAPAGATGFGSAWFVNDFAQYESAMRHGAARAGWLVYDPFTSEPHPPTFMFPLYVAIGQLGATLHLPAIALEQALEIAARGVLVLALWRFCRAFARGRVAARWAVGLALFASGFELFAGLIGGYTGNWSYEMNGFGLLFAAPHVPLAMAATLELAREGLRPFRRVRRGTTSNGASGGSHGAIERDTAGVSHCAMDQATPDISQSESVARRGSQGATDRDATAGPHGAMDSAAPGVERSALENAPPRGSQGATQPDTAGPAHAAFERDVAGVSYGAIDSAAPGVERSALENAAPHGSVENAARRGSQGAMRDVALAGPRPAAGGRGAIDVGWWLAKIACLSAVVALLHPFHAPVLLGAIFVAGLAFWRSGRGTANIMAALVACVAAVPVLAPTVATFSFQPFWVSTYSSQNLLPSPAPHELLVDLGPTLLLAIAGAVMLRGRVAPFGLLLWLLLAVIAMYLPVPYQRRLSFGLQPMLAVLAANALIAAAQRPGDKRARVLRLGTVALAASSTVLVLISLVASMFTNAPLPVYRSTADLDAAAAWLDAHATPSDVILADWDASNYLAARTPARVYGGHPVATLHPDQKKLAIATVFAHSTSSLTVAAGLGAQWVVYGAAEADIAGPTDPAFQSGVVRVYRVA